MSFVLKKYYAALPHGLSRKCLLPMAPLLAGRYLEHMLQFHTIFSMSRENPSHQPGLRGTLVGIMFGLPVSGMTNLLPLNSKSL